VAPPGDREDRVALSVRLAFYFHFRDSKKTGPGRRGPQRPHAAFAARVALPRERVPVDLIFWVSVVEPETVR
jgi:hypothetical protein